MTMPACPVQVIATYIIFTESSDSDGSIETGVFLTRLATSSALFVLGIKEQHKLTQVATQGIIEGVTNLMQVSYRD